MTLLRKCNFQLARAAARFYGQAAGAKLFHENLSLQRSVVRVAGDEVNGFLQGLITNDINHINPSSPNAALYTMFLNKPGRVLYDAIIFRRKTDENVLFIDCDRRIDAQLVKHLQIFRVRKKIAIDIVNDDFAVHAIYHEQPTNASPDDSKVIMDFDAGVAAAHDPRLHALGMRLIVPTNVRLKTANLLAAEPSYTYARHRYVNGVPEGIIEIQSQKCFPFEVNCDYMHGISFHKGCYLGQEFTARTYHTGVIRKRIMPISIDAITDAECQTLEYDAAILDDNGQSLGKLKGVCNGNAIGILRIDKAMDAKHLQIGPYKASTRRPEWWPKAKTNPSSDK